MHLLCIFLRLFTQTYFIFHISIVTIKKVCQLHVGKGGYRGVKEARLPVKNSRTVSSGIQNMQASGRGRCQQLSTWAYRFRLAARVLSQFRLRPFPSWAKWAYSLTRLPQFLYHTSTTTRTIFVIGNKTNISLMFLL